ncbi:MAG TPA: hypothetical protein VHP83_22210 [Aggregatilineaceae bacterium]|nr:hypothetical protein [Aggregatilineaceae bacterium]
MKNRWTWSLTLIVVVLLSSLSLPTPTRAAGDKLELLSEVDGTLSDQASEQSYSVNFLAGQVFSVQVWPKSGDLQLEMEVVDAAGVALAQSVPVDVVPGAALLEAVEAPEDGSYSITVRRVGATAGDFGLMVVPGFGNVSTVDYFDGTGYNPLTWCECKTSDFTATLADGEYMMELTDVDRHYSMRPEEVIIRDEVYVEATFRLEENRPRYYGFGFNMVDKADGSFNLYVVSITRDGLLDIYALTDNGIVELLPWQANPLIDNTDSTVQLAVLFQDYTFTVYFNGQVIGQVEDPDHVLAPGELAISMETVNNPDHVPARIYVDNLIITEPLGNVAAAESTDAPVDADTIGSILDQSRSGAEGIGLNPKLDYPVSEAESRALPINAIR